VALAKVEKAYAAYQKENLKEVGRDEKKIAELEQNWKAAIAQADEYVVLNEFGEIVESQGGLGMNANTDHDETAYYYSFPQNRLELWAYLESERFIHPVMREFYKERDVVYEERRMSTDSSPRAGCWNSFWAPRSSRILTDGRSSDGLLTLRRFPRPMPCTFFTNTMFRRTSWSPWWVM